MSEYQWVEFRAVDAPLDEDEIDFMSSQSTRAEIDRWSFKNEYTFGDFRGNSLTMVRRGYDLHLHYANFGYRRVWMRFRDGFAYADDLKYYLVDDQVTWLPDDVGTGGILMIDPEGDAGTWDEFWDIEELMDTLVCIRQMIDLGDMRPLYVLYLTLSYRDDEKDDEMEPPVPVGLKENNRNLATLLSFYEVDRELLEVASEVSKSPTRKKGSEQSSINEWIGSNNEDELAAHLQRVLESPEVYPRQLLRQIRQAVSTTRRQHRPGTRTLRELRTEVARRQAEERRKREEKMAAEEAAKNARDEKIRQAILTEIQSAPDKLIRRVDQAVNERNRPAYQRASVELNRLAEACGRDVAQRKADQLRAKFPDRSALSDELHRAGF